MEAATKNFAISGEGKITVQVARIFDNNSLSSEKIVEFDYVEEPIVFDPVENLTDALGRALSEEPYAESLLYAAAQAQQRIVAQQDDDPEDWAKRMSKVIFRDLDNQ